MDASFERVMEKIQRIDDWDNPKRLRHYILDLCKQIVDRTKDLDEQKAQYRVLSDYLMDIRKLGSLNQKQDKTLRSIVTNLITAEKAKNDYENVRHKLSEEQYVLVEANQKKMPGEITQMRGNEDDRFRLKRQIQRLEGSKSEKEIDREHNRYLRETMKKMSILLLGACAALGLLFVMIQVTSEVDMTWGTLILLFFMALFVLFTLMKNTQMRREYRRDTSELNQTISMLNVARMKFASVTAAIEFLQRKYHIRTSYELNAMWDYFLEERQIRLKNIQDNEDYKYYYRRLFKFLGELNLHDTNMWLDQTTALVNEDDMQKVKSSLVSAREKLRTHMEENKHMIEEERDEITQVMREHDYYPPEIVEIVASVDQKCGLNINYHFRNAQ